MSDKAGGNKELAIRQSAAMGLFEKQQIRAAVLRSHYELNEQYPGTYGNAREIAELLGTDLRIIVGAGLYLIGKGFLDPGDDGIAEEIGNRAVPDYYARITDRGIDFVEDPTAWHGREVPGSLVYIFAGGDVSGISVAARDLQTMSTDLFRPASSDER